MTTDKENTANPPLVESIATTYDDDDEAAFLPPGFLMPKESSVSIGLSAFLQDSVSDFLVERDHDNVCYDADPGFLNHSYISDGLDQDIDVGLLCGILNKAKPEDNDDTPTESNKADNALDLKLDELALSLRAEVLAGHQMIQDMEAKPAVSIDDVDGIISIAPVPQSTTREMKSFSDTSTQATTEVKAEGELCNGEKVCEDYANIIEKLRIDKTQLEADKAELITTIEKLTTEKGQLKNDLEWNTTKQLQTLQSEHETQMVVIKGSCNEKLGELRAVIEGQRAAFVEAKQQNAKFRSMQRRIGSLESLLKETLVSKEKVLEVNKIDQSKIRSLQRRIGALRAAQEAAKEALELEKEKVRSLQRRLGVVETERQDNEILQGKIRSLQRCNGALEAKLVEHQAVHSIESEEAMQIKDHEISALQHQVCVLQDKVKRSFLEFNIDKKEVTCVESTNLEEQIDSLRDELAISKRVHEFTLKASKDGHRSEIDSLHDKLSEMKNQLEIQTDFCDSMVRTKDEEILLLKSSANVSLKKAEEQVSAFKESLDENRKEVYELHDKIALDRTLRQKSNAKDSEKQNLLSVRKIQELQNRVHTLETDLQEREISNLEKIAYIQSENAANLKSLLIEKDRFLTIAREACDQTNVLFQRKISDMQRIIDRQHTETEIEIAYSEAITGETTREIEALKRDCIILNENLFNTLQREEQIKKVLSSTLLSTETELKALTQTHIEEMNILRDQFELIEEELMETLDREEEYAEERDLLIAQNELQNESSAVAIQVTKEKCSEVIAAAQKELEKVVSQNSSLQTILYSLNDQLSSTNQTSIALRESLALQRQALDCIREEKVADCVDLFKECRSFFKDEYECRSASLCKKIVLQYEQQIADMKEEHIASMVTLFRQTSKAKKLQESPMSAEENTDDEIRQYSSQSDSAPSLTFDQRVPSYLNPLPVMVKLFIPSQDITSIRENEAKAVVVESLQSPNSAFCQCNTSQNKRSLGIAATESLSLSSIASSKRNNKPLAKIKRGDALEGVSNLDSKIRPVTFEKIFKKTAEPLSMDIASKCNENAHHSYPKLSPMSSPPTRVPFFDTVSSLNPPQKKISLDFSSPKIKIDKLQFVRTTPNISAAKAKLRAMEAKRYGSSLQTKAKSIARPSMSRVNETRVIPASSARCRLTRPNCRNVHRKASLDVSFDGNKLPIVSLEKPSDNLNTKLGSRLLQPTTSVALKRQIRVSSQPQTADSTKRASRKSNVDSFTVVKSTELKLKEKSRLLQFRGAKQSFSTSCRASQVTKPNSSIESPKKEMITNGARKESTLIQLSKTPPKPKELLRKLEALKVSVATPLLSTTKKPLRKRSIGTSLNGAGVPTKLKFSSSKEKFQSVPKSPKLVSQASKRTKVNHSLQLHKPGKLSVPKAMPDYKQYTPLKVGEGILDVFSPASPLLTPIESKKAHRITDADYRVRAVVQIQSFVRKHQALSVKKKLRELHAKELTNALRANAIHIQKAVRRWSSLRAYKRQVSAIRIQKMTRRLSRRSSYLHLRHSIIILQFSLRIFLRKQMMIRAATAIQKQWRVFPAKKRLLEIRQQKIQAQAAVTKIIRHWRGVCARRYFLIVRHAAILLQAALRGANTRLQYKFLSEARFLEHSAAIRIQKIARKYICRNAYLSSIKRIQESCAISRIQSQWRMKVCRFNLSRILSGIISIQANVRRLLTRKKFTGDLLVVSKAATRIQNIWRMNKAWNRYHSMLVAIQSQHFSAALIQSGWRMHAWRLWYVGTVIDAIVLQTFVRRVLAQRRTREKKNEIIGAIVQIQSAWRMRQVRAAFKSTIKSIRLIQVLAARKIQKRWRCVVYLRKAQDSRKEKLAATCRIQCFSRKVLCRNHFTLVRNSIVMIQVFVRRSLAQKSMLKNKMEERCAALRIQSFWRMRAYRIAYQSSIKNIQLVQTYWRRLIQFRKVQKYRERMLAATLRIQSYSRMVSIRSNYMLARKAIVIVQSSVRQFVKLRLTKKSQVAALCIQSHWRMVRARKHFQDIIRVVIVMQTLTKRNIVLWKERNISVTLIQNHWRMVSLRRDYKAVVGACLLIQKLFRGYFLHKMASVLKERTSSAIYLQCTWRKFSDRQKFMILRASVVSLQRAARGFTSRKQYSKLIQRNNAATIIQCHWRRFIAQHLVKSSCQAVVALQKNVRGFFARCQFKRISIGTVIIQRAVRARLTKLFEKRIQASVLLQSRFRMACAMAQFFKIRQATLLIQCVVRGHLARKSSWGSGVQNSILSILKVSSPPKSYKARPKEIVKRIASKRTHETLEAEKHHNSARSSTKMNTVASNRKIFGDILTHDPKKKISKSSHGHCSRNKPQAFDSPLKTRKSKQIDCSSFDSENINNQTLLSLRTSHSMNTQKDALNSYTELCAIVEKSKVADLRLELKALGLESKAYRNLRKADLVDLVVEHRLGKVQSSL